MIDHDKNVGQLLDYLDELGIADNTFVMYSTDNGPHRNTLAGSRPPRRSAARRTPTGKALSAFRWWCAGPARSRPAGFRPRSSSTTTGSRHSWRWRANPIWLRRPKKVITRPQEPAPRWCAPRAHSCGILVGTPFTSPHPASCAGKAAVSRPPPPGSDSQEIVRIGEVSGVSGMGRTVCTPAITLAPQRELAPARSVRPRTGLRPGSPGTRARGSCLMDAFTARHPSAHKERRARPAPRPGVGGRLPGRGGAVGARRPAPSRRKHGISVAQPGSARRLSP